MLREEIERKIGLLVFRCEGSDCVSLKSVLENWEQVNFLSNNYHHRVGDILEQVVNDENNIPHVLFFSW